MPHWRTTIWRRLTKNIAQITDMAKQPKIKFQPKLSVELLEIQLQQARVLIASMYIQKDGWSERVKAEVKKFML